MLSFHATKVFNTFEGGAIVCPDAKTKQRIDFLKNFGFADEVTVVAPGINGKMNEFQAAFGLLQLKVRRGRFAERREIDGFYRETTCGMCRASRPWARSRASSGTIPISRSSSRPAYPLLARRTLSTSWRGAAFMAGATSIR